MKIICVAIATLLIAAVSACSSSSTTIDAGLPDAGPADTGVADAGCTAAQDLCDSASDRILLKCVDGSMTKVDCMATQGMLCWESICVEPAKYGAPSWGKCTDIVGATSETLSEKAAFYDRIMPEVHLNPISHITHYVVLKDGHDIKTATSGEDVEFWLQGENDGLWSGHYLASQAFRYAVTKSPEALANIKALIKGHKDLMGVTGKPGNYARQFVPAGEPKMKCPDNTASYNYTLGVQSKSWAKIDTDGCLVVFDVEKKDWSKLDYCVDKKYAGYCFEGDVSQDSYIGSIYALGIVHRLVDDPDVQAEAAKMLDDSIMGFIQSGMQLVDWTGMVTTFGKIYPTSFQDFPGFSAIMALSYVKTAQSASSDVFFKNFYEMCLTKKKKATKDVDCSLTHVDESYVSFVPDHGLYKTIDGCGNNYNNFNMTFMGLHTLLWFETDADTRDTIALEMENTMMHEEGKGRPMNVQKNSYFNFIYGATKKLGKGSTGPAYNEVEDAVCSLRTFPTSKAYYTRIENSKKYPFDCSNRLGAPDAAIPIPTNERSLWVFTWSADPYIINDFGPQTKGIEIGADYLLPYWMGRYYGFISEEM